MHDPRTDTYPLVERRPKVVTQHGTFVPTTVWFDYASSIEFYDGADMDDTEAIANAEFIRAGCPGGIDGGVE
jgi:hypothetical protein